MCDTYYKSNLVYAGFFTSIFNFSKKKNDSAHQMSVIIIFTSGHYDFFWKIKNWGKKSA